MKSTESGITVVEMKFLRSAVDRTRVIRERNKIIRERELELLVEDIERIQLKFNGCVSRVSVERILTKFLNEKTG